MNTTKPVPSFDTLSHEEFISIIIGLELLEAHECRFPVHGQEKADKTRALRKRIENLMVDIHQPGFRENLALAKLAAETKTPKRYRYHSEWCDRMDGVPECNCELSEPGQTHD